MDLKRTRKEEARAVTELRTLAFSNSGRIAATARTTEERGAVVAKFWEDGRVETRFVLAHEIRSLPLDDGSLQALSEWVARYRPEDQVVVLAAREHPAGMETHVCVIEVGSDPARLN